MEPQAPAPLVSIRTMNVVVAALLMIVAGVVMMDSLRLGIGWTAEGPASGYFPFYIGLILALASGVNLLQALRADSLRTFVTKPAFRSVLAVLLPLVGYVLVLGYVGIYFASAAYVALFMWRVGRYSLGKGAVVGIALAVALFLMFEVWFLVPLPKGPVESLFGY
jgi:putative tricarboxylic transport membrane protein